MRRRPGPGPAAVDGCLARVSSSRDAFVQREMTMDDLRPSDYAYRAIRRRFDDLDRGKKGYVEAEDGRCWSKRLRRQRKRPGAGVRCEREVVTMTFEELTIEAERVEDVEIRRDPRYLTSKQLKRVLMREGYATNDANVEAMMMGSRPERGFSKGKGLFNAFNEIADAGQGYRFQNSGILMLSDAMDASDALTVWSQSMEIDYGDVARVRE